ncbi:hypothetical protein [Maridesulfovibrio sp.]
MGGKIDTGSGDDLLKANRIGSYLIDNSQIDINTETEENKIDTYIS